MKRTNSVLRAVKSARAAERKTVDSVIKAQGKSPGKFKDAAKKLFTTDSFQNFALGLGMGTDNALSQSTYGYYPITRIRVLLEWIHRGSWLGGVAVDVVADDMTSAGIDVLSTMPPDDVKLLQKALVRTGVWSSINECYRWGRLYGGAIGVILIDGQDTSTELRLETVGKGQFNGVLVLDRWLVNPNLQDLVFSPEHGMVPRYYDVPPGTMGLPGMRIHWSRVLRVEGVRLPYQQRLTENLWGLSVYERLYDRLIAFDSATTGAAQLVYKSYLRYLKIADLRKIAAEGGMAMQALLKYVDMMRRFQGIEGMTLIDGKDEFGIQAHQPFSGISDILMQFGQQISGALQIPLVRLFGQSPAGLNSSGESDLRTYYDGIKSQQEKHRIPLERIIRVAAQSDGIKMPDDFEFSFRPLWQLKDEQKAEVAERITKTVTDALGAGVGVSPQVALKELRQQSRITGIWTNVTDEDIAAAEEAPPPASELPPEGEEDPSPDGNGTSPGVERPGGVGRPPPPGHQEGEEPSALAKAAKARDTHPGLPLRDFHGLPVVIECLKGDQRWQGGPLSPADYGYIRGTWSAEGRDEEIDCMLGGDSPLAYVVDSYTPRGKFDEHKIMLGYPSLDDALRDFEATYGISRHARTTTLLDVPRLRDWLADGDMTKPLAAAL